MFTEEEIKFIEAMLEDEQAVIAFKRQWIEDNEDIKEFNKIMADREIFIINLLRKIKQLKQ